MPRHELRVASFNLQNLQLPDRTTYYGNPPYGEGNDQDASYAEKLSWIAYKLKDMDADVIAFQELWVSDCLQDAFVQAGLDAEYTLVTNDAIEGSISVALAFRNNHLELVAGKEIWTKLIPPPANRIRKYVEPYGESPDYAMYLEVPKFSRAILACTLRDTIVDEEVTFYVAHLKSKLAMRLSARERTNFNIGAHGEAIGKFMSGARRQAEAAGLRVLLRDQMVGSNDAVIVMGDLNDAELTDTIDIITQEPAYNLSTTSSVGRRSDAGLYMAAAMHDFTSRRDVLYTYKHRGRRVMLDHIMFSEQLYDASNNRRWSFDTMRIINDHLDASTVLKSDHGIPIVTFVHNPAV